MSKRSGFLRTGPDTHVEGLRDAGGLANYVGSWFAGDVSQAADEPPPSRRYGAGSHAG